MGSLGGRGEPTLVVSSTERVRVDSSSRDWVRSDKSIDLQIGSLFY